MISCLTDEHPDTLELIPITAVEGETEMFLGETLEIDVDFIRPTNCHLFNNFHIEQYNALESYIAIRMQFTDINGCELSNTNQTVTYYFKPTQIGTHVLRFWNTDAENPTGETYIEHTVEVHNP